jgi:hypothetical protein
MTAEELLAGVLRRAFCSLTALGNVRVFQLVIFWLTASSMGENPHFPSHISVSSWTDGMIRCSTPITEKIWKLNQK